MTRITKPPAAISRIMSARSFVEPAVASLGRAARRARYPDAAWTGAARPWSGAAAARPDRAGGRGIGGRGRSRRRQCQLIGAWRSPSAADRQPPAGRARRRAPPAGASPRRRPAPPPARRQAWSPADQPSSTSTLFWSRSTATSMLVPLIPRLSKGVRTSTSRPGVTRHRPQAARSTRRRRSSPQAPREDQATVGPDDEAIAAEHQDQVARRPDLGLTARGQHLGVGDRQPADAARGRHVARPVTCSTTQSPAASATSSAPASTGGSAAALPGGSAPARSAPRTQPGPSGNMQSRSDHGTAAIDGARPRPERPATPEAELQIERASRSGSSTGRPVETPSTMPSVRRSNSRAFGLAGVEPQSRGRSRACSPRGWAALRRQCVRPRARPSGSAPRAPPGGDAARRCCGEPRRAARARRRSQGRRTRWRWSRRSRSAPPPRWLPCSRLTPGGGGGLDRQRRRQGTALRLPRASGGHRGQDDRLDLLDLARPPRTRNASPPPAGPPA